MSDGSTIEIKNGIKGKDGIDAPHIGIKQDTDGQYYWTLGGTFLLQNGQKLRVTGNNGTNGQDGTNGITPLLRVNQNGNYWMISYDNGSNWQPVTDGNGNTIPATGAAGAPGQQGPVGPQGPAGPSDIPGFGITETDDTVIITYQGNTYTLPKAGSTGETEYKIILATNKYPAANETIRLIINAALPDRSDIWIDLNNDKVQDGGEKVHIFGMFVNYPLTITNTVTLYGKITLLNCANNELTALDVSKNKALTWLRCDDNNLSTLDVSENTTLATLYCAKNQIKEAGMTALLNGMPARLAADDAKAYILTEADPAEGNELPSAAAIPLAKNKNWKLYKWNAGNNLTEL